ncbi:MAG: DsbC family protein [Gammaproteobacteria bacterium]|uniref:Thiol:disulfide interchange protein n=1 Tax=Marinobacter nitratireducens TaxID=1137280 RepID=A0A072N1K8_9GAMM|nr:DsbC family protein [Marinobacter nitratireducens]KEF31087.1 Thiol:disulfide interchange protein DsbC [Marinobacter nitratireducens]TNE73214.1 MAG: DsbC family protein [Gammaproteobacteria bacterium]
MSARRSLKCVAAVLGMSVAALLSAPLVAGEVEDRIAERLSAAVPGLQVSSVRESEAEGLYEVQSNNGETIYTTVDGQYLLTGDMLKITDTGIANVTEQARTGQRRKVMESFGDDGVISFPAEGDEKAVISVFTDIDCPYCRKLHNEVGQLNGYGITVNYYAFPRSGPNTESFRKYESVWCADDQQAAMDAAKAGRRVEAAECENPVLEQYRLGGQVGVTGTPAIVLEDGTMVRGYVPADNLAKGLGLL